MDFEEIVMALSEVPYLQMTSVGSHRKSGGEKERRDSPIAFAYSDDFNYNYLPLEAE